MSESNGVTQLLDQAIGGNDTQPTNEEKQIWLRSRFEFERRILMRNQAHMLDKEDWWLVFDCIEHLENLLREGVATREMQIMLADYLRKHVLNHDEKMAHEILGSPKEGGRPNKELYVQRSAAAYENHIGAGKSDNLAIEAAWQAYYTEKNIDREQSRPPNDDGLTPYELQVKNTIKPLLRDSKARNPKRGGRPGKKAKKP